MIASGAIRQKVQRIEYAPIRFPAVPHFEVLSAQVESAKRLNLPYHVGVVQSKDSFLVSMHRKQCQFIKSCKTNGMRIARLDCLASRNGIKYFYVFIVGQTRHVRECFACFCIYV